MTSFQGAILVPIRAQAERVRPLPQGALPATRRFRDHRGRVSTSSLASEKVRQSGGGRAAELRTPALPRRVIFAEILVAPKREADFPPSLVLVVPAELLALRRRERSDLTPDLRPGEVCCQWPPNR